MAFRKRSSKRSKRSSNKTQATDKTQRDPVIVQQKPTEEVAKAVRAMPEAPAPVAPKVVAVSKYGKLEYFKEEFIDSLNKNPVDLLAYYDNAKKAYQTLRSSNLPGDDERATNSLHRLNELRRIVVDLGYPG